MLKHSWFTNVVDGTGPIQLKTLKYENNQDEGPKRPRGPQ